MNVSTYATYVSGLELEGPIHGLLTLTEDSLHFETFERKGALESLLPEPWRPKRPKVDLIIPRAEIAQISDLFGATQSRERSRLSRLSTWLNLEPNGIRVMWGDKTVIFDCEQPVDALLSST